MWQFAYMFFGQLLICDPTADSFVSFVCLVCTLTIMMPMKVRAVTMLAVSVGLLQCLMLSHAEF